MAANAMTPQEFIAKWRRSRGQESAGAQEWFIDLCRVVEHPTPAELDPRQEWYTFERAVRSRRAAGAAPMCTSAAISPGSSRGCTGIWTRRIASCNATGRR